MAFSRALGVISIISVSWFAAVGCGDDDDKDQQAGAAGEGGEAGQGVAGSTVGGTTAGGATSGGEAGQSVGGTAGGAGAAAGADAGGQPTLGGAGGEPPMSVAGAAGDGGAGGEGPVAQSAKQCGAQCEVSADCVVAGAEEQKVCDPTFKRCVVDGSFVCEKSSDCTPPANGWAPCGSSADCETPSEACVLWDGEGYCARVNLDGCEFPDSAADLPEVGVAASNVSICVWFQGCRDGVCEPGCEAFGCEDSGDGDTCGEETHLCECASGNECGGLEGEGTGVCGADHFCAQCVTDQDCIGKNTPGLDQCVAGRCGCAAAASCPDVTESGVPVCE